MYRCTPEVEVVDEERPGAGVSGKRVDANRRPAPARSPPRGSFSPARCRAGTLKLGNFCRALPGRKHDPDRRSLPELAFDFNAAAMF